MADWDPQGNKWAADKSRFGYKMLEKLGWSQGKGLGVAEQGSTTHIRAERRYENMGMLLLFRVMPGIGADGEMAKNTYVETTAAYGDLLKRLNDGKEAAADPVTEAAEEPTEKKHKKHKEHKKHKKHKEEQDKQPEEPAAVEHEDTLEPAKRPKLETETPKVFT